MADDYRWPPRSVQDVAKHRRKVIRDLGIPPGPGAWDKARKQLDKKVK